MKQINLPNPCNIRQALTASGQLFSKLGFATPQLDARVLLSFVTNLAMEDIVKKYEDNLSDEQLKSFTEVVNERANGKPVSKILGYKYFWKYKFFTSEDVLDPRNDSETLIEHVLATFQDKTKELKIIDLGVGSGCLIISLLLEYKNSKGTGIDISDKAIEIAKKNLNEYKLNSRLNILKSNWLENINEKFDIIISNPPYIITKDIENLSVEVKKFDPYLALNGGEDGLDCYRTIAKELKKIVSETSIIFFEIGQDQLDDLINIMSSQGFECLSYLEDLNGIIRSCAFQIKH
ncbi:MAG: peptide chain release factor N(5)-glutamine methyltransferase [Sphingobacteriia bacterium]|nr:peptide chain release factor N(5)-glutamine methyltransferase [Sphingobacteriia bacterium]